MLMIRIEVDDKGSNVRLWIKGEYVIHPKYHIEELL